MSLIKIDQEKITQLEVKRAKAVRTDLVNSIVVDVDGKKFDGNEEAQTRMSRAILSMNEDETALWVLADNIPSMVTRDELRRALRLSGEEQTRIWVTPYQNNTEEAGE